MGFCMINYIIFAAFQLGFMTIAVNIKDGHGSSNKMCHQLQIKKTKVTLSYVAVNKAAKGMLCTVYY